MQKKPKETKIIKSAILVILVIIFLAFNGFLLGIYSQAVNNYDVRCVLFQEMAKEQNCTQITINIDEFEEKTGLRIEGIYDAEKDEIRIIEGGYKTEEVIMKHELCHRKQNQKGRLYGCENKAGVILNEFECSLMEKL